MVSAPPAPSASTHTGLANVCRDFMRGRCSRPDCRFIHDRGLCFDYWKSGDCKFGAECRKRHTLDTLISVPDLRYARDSTSRPDSSRQSQRDSDGGRDARYDDKPRRDSSKEQGRAKRPPKNTQDFQPMTKPVDMRVVYDLGYEQLTTPLTSRDVLLVPNLFSDYHPGEIYEQLVAEIKTCGVPEERLLKLWHGDTHLIADDHTHWKKNAPTFTMALERLASFFRMDVQATRFNWYTDTAHWKPFHHDAAALKPAQAAVQNFTVAVSFGATRDVAFEDARTQTVISMPQPDGCAYAFSRDTNILWKHGILQEKEVRPEGRISIIAWGWIEGQENIQPCPPLLGK